MTAAADRRRWIFVVPGALLAWIVLDLYLPITLPGAPRLEHLAFLSVGALIRLLEEEAATDVLVLDVVLGVAVVLAAGGLAAWQFGGRRLWQLGLAGLALAQVGVLVVASLMERAAALGILVACVLALRGAPAQAQPPAGGRRDALIGLAVATVPGVYVFAVFTASSDGYGLLDLLGAAGGRVLYVAWAASLVLATGLSLRFGLPPAEGARRRTLVRAALAGMAATAVARLLIDPGLPWISAVLIAPGGAAVVLGLRAKVGVGGMDPLRWPRGLLPATVAAALLFGHAYAARVFSCPTELPEGVERLADGADVFEVVLGGGGDVLLLSSRSGRRFLALDVQPTVGTVRATTPDAIPSPPAQGLPPGTTYGFAEEIEYLPEQDAFLGTVVAVSHDFFLQENSPAHDVNNALVHIRGDGSRADHLHGRSRLCWVGNMAWDPLRSRVLLGCEYDSRIWTYDPASDEVAYGFEAPELADVAAFAVDDRPDRDFVYTVSMWTGDRITKLAGESLEIQAQRRLGDAHYALELDPSTDRLFASSYYRSVVNVVDAEDLRTVDSIATGLGARAVGVDSSRGLVLASSVYDGMVRVCRTEDAEVLRRLHVGGHVKDIAIDEERGLAYFANPCGIFRLNLEAIP